jgi:CheY-like chemotaxis protein
MTAKVQSGEIDALKALGAVDVIPKPFDPMTLSDQLHAIWKAARA